MERVGRRSRSSLPLEGETRRPEGWWASASIACSPPNHPPAVCFPSGPFCFSSISDFATLSLRLRVTPNSTLIFSLRLLSSVVVRLSASTNTWHLPRSVQSRTTANASIIFVFFFFFYPLRLLYFNIFLLGSKTPVCLCRFASFPLVFETLNHVY